MKIKKNQISKMIAGMMSAAIFLFAGMPISTYAMETSEETEEDVLAGIRIAVISKNTSGDFWDTIESGMKQAIADVNKEYGFEKENKVTMTFEGPTEETKIEDQINRIDIVLAENPDVLCLAASDMESCRAQLENATENQIPVVMFDSCVNYSLYDAFCGTDNKEVGRIAAEKMAEAQEDKGEILVLAHQDKTDTSVLRVEGFEAELRKHENMQLSEVLYKNTEEDFADTVQRFLDTHENITGIFCTNEEVSETYLGMQKKYEDRNITLIGVDASKKQLAAVKEGKEYGIVGQQPYEMGYQTIMSAVNIVRGKQTDKEIILSVGWIDQQNMNSEECKKYNES